MTPTSETGSRKRDYNPSSRLLRFLPLPIRQRVRAARKAPALVKDFVADYLAFLRHSSTAGFSQEDQVLSRITATYHNIEKGLSLPNPRPGFGAKNLRLLLDLLKVEGIDPDAEPVVTARHVLAAYLAFNERVQCENVPYKVEIAAAASARTGHEEGRGGLRQVSKADILAATAGVSDRFFLDRHSVRQYSDEPVDLSLISGAIAAAQKAPAVCNRQNSFVYVAEDPDVVATLLEVQGGSRGFSEGVNRLLVVTTRLSNFWESGERHQPWVDGGLFSMALIYALHARALGTVALNWSRSARDSARLRAMLGMRDDEQIMMMIGVGHLPDAFEVPVSHRRDVEQSYRVVTKLERE